VASFAFTASANQGEFVRFSGTDFGQHTAKGDRFLIKRMNVERSRWPESRHRGRGASGVFLPDAQHAPVSVLVPRETV
jgi:hypothetical protein